MTKLKHWTGLLALLLSLQANASEINIKDVWIRTLAPGQGDAIVGMVINSARQARIISAISPAYMAVTIQGPSKSGANKTQELEFIDLPAQKSVVLDTGSVHLLLTGNKQNLGATDKVPVFITVQFEDNTSKTMTVMALPPQSKSAAPLASKVEAQASTDMPLTAPRNPVELPSKVEAKTVTPPQPAPSKTMASPVEVAKPAKPVAPPKPPVAEVKPLKAEPVAARVVTAPIPAPVTVVAPSAAPLVAEPKKAPEAKPAEQPKQEEAKVSAECFSLAAELRECDKVNDMMLDWCVTSAKSKYSCKLPMDQVKKLRN